MITAINQTTFKAENLGDVKPLVIIGGSDTTKFVPNINMSFHDDEFFINLNRNRFDEVDLTKIGTGRSNG